MKKTNHIAATERDKGYPCALCGCAAHDGPCDHRAALAPLPGGDADEQFMSGPRHLFVAMHNNRRAQLEQLAATADTGVSAKELL